MTGFTASILAFVTPWALAGAAMAWRDSRKAQSHRFWRAVHGRKLTLKWLD